MFEVVTVERRARRRIQRASTLTLSVLAHAAVVAVVLLVPVQVVRERAAKVEEEVRYFDLPPAPTAAAVPRSGSGGGSGGAVRVATPRESAPVPPAVVPDHIPEPAPALAGVGTELALGAIVRDTVETESLREGAAAERGPVEAGDAVNFWELRELPKLSNPRTMSMLWSELYPLRQLVRRVEGQAVVSFVINADGRVDPETLALVSATHPDFGQATLRGARRMRFRPARMDGQPVRVRAMMPVSWVLPSN